MRSTSITPELQGTDLSDLPDVHRLDDERLQVFWALEAAGSAGIADDLSAAEVSEVLTQCCGIAVSRQRASGILKIDSRRKRKTVAKRTADGRPYYRLMQLGRDDLFAGSGGSLFIDPDQAYSAIRQAEEIFRGLRGFALVCDPYVDSRTLDYLVEFESAQSIRLLTVNIYKESRFKRDLKAFNKQHPGRLEVRVVAPGQLHDRYVIHDDGMLLLGASLNGLGGKQSFIVSLGDDIRASVLQAFNRSWGTARSYP